MSRLGAHDRNKEVAPELPGPPARNGAKCLQTAVTLRILLLQYRSHCRQGREERPAREHMQGQIPGHTAAADYQT